jgi:F-type H+-transporting ATPase subunit c
MKVLRTLALVAVVFFTLAMPAMAQTKAPAPGTYVFSGQSIGAGLGAALTIVGAGIGFGRIGAAALEGMARQPEVAPRIQTAMIIIAALLEGVTFLALIVCILITLGIGTPVPL